MPNNFRKYNAGGIKKEGVRRKAGEMLCFSEMAPTLFSILLTLFPWRDGVHGSSALIWVGLCLPWKIFHPGGAVTSETRSQKLIQFPPGSPGPGVRPCETLNFHVRCLRLPCCEEAESTSRCRIWFITHLQLRSLPIIRCENKDASRWLPLLGSTSIHPGPETPRNSCHCCSLSKLSHWSPKSVIVIKWLSLVTRFWGKFVIYQ